MNEGVLLSWNWMRRRQTNLASAEDFARRAGGALSGRAFRARADPDGLDLPRFLARGRLPATAPRGAHRDALEGAVGVVPGALKALSGP